MPFASRPSPVGVRRSSGRAIAITAAVLSLLALVASPAGAVPGPAEADASVAIGAHVSVSTLRLGLSTTVVGHITPPTALGSVILQRQVGGVWLDRAKSGPVAADGAFSVTITPSELGTYLMRVRSPGGSVVSNEMTLTVVPPPTISAKASTSATTVGSAVVISGTVKPAGATSRVVSQRLVDGRWEDRQAANPDAAGRYAITVSPSAIGRYRMRVRSSQGSIASPSIGFVAWVDKAFDVYDTGLAKGERVVALTFDDGPSPKYTPQVLDILAKNKVKATFFEVGRSISYWPDVSRRVVREGHRLANHSWDHPQLTQLSDDAVVSQLQRTQDQITKVGGSSICVRPPYGAQSARVRSLITSRMHSSTILWDIDPGDWRGYAASTIVSRTLSQVRPGSIILLHDGGSNRGSTVEALAQLIPALKARGYSFVTLC